MSTARLKNAMIKRAIEDWGGLLQHDCATGYSSGDRFGRLSRRQVELNRRIDAAIQELETEGRIRWIRHNVWQVNPTQGKQ